VRYQQGDTDLLPEGSGGSSALVISGSAIARGSDDLIGRARQLAAQELETAPEDIAYAQGELHVLGTDRVVTLAELARRIEAGQHAGVAALEGVGEFVPNRQPSRTARRHGVLPLRIMVRNSSTTRCGCQACSPKEVSETEEAPD